MDVEETVISINTARPLDELEVIYLELLANGTFDRLEEIADADWAALADDEAIGQHFGQYPFLY